MLDPLASSAGLNFTICLGTIDVMDVKLCMIVAFILLLIMSVLFRSVCCLFDVIHLICVKNMTFCGVGIIFCICFLHSAKIYEFWTLFCHCYIFLFKGDSTVEECCLLDYEL